MIDSPYLVKPGKKLDLLKHKSNETGGFKDKQAGEAAAADNARKLCDLQDVLFAQASHALLVVLQGMDTAGKDGTIKHVFDAVNPQGCAVTSFKVPSANERAHDYLWRIHAAVPSRGMIGIFNRSHYESVLVERVNELAPRDVWKKRYDHINEFERMLADEGVTIIKFFLNISRDEQRRRLQARLDVPEKRWKFNPDDLRQRQRWNDYLKAYQDALEKCSSRHAPWYVIPADHKWFRNWAVSDTLVRTLEAMNLKYPAPAQEIEKYRIE